MTRRQVILAGLALWALALILSGLAFALEPTGESFTRGLNRLAGFLAGQLAASVLAAILFFLAGGLQKGETLRRLARIPILLMVLGWAVLIGVILLSIREGSQPPADTAPRPVTAPAETAVPVEE